MNPDEFRKAALSFDGVSEAEHNGHPDFRVRGRIFATLGYPDSNSGMVKVSPEMQARLTRSRPEVFAPAPGAWGQHGSTLVKLDQARRDEVRKALAAAWERLAESLRPE